MGFETPVFTGVYLVWDETSDAIKVGYAGDIFSRIGQLQIGNPNRLSLICTLEGDRETEDLIHRLLCRLGARRIRGEWFRCSEGDLRFFESFAKRFMSYQAKCEAEERMGEETADSMTLKEMGFHGE